MSSVIEQLEPTIVFTHFAELLRRPRGSGNEAAAREYVLEFARNHDFDARVDGVGNVIVSVPASPGLEAAPTVILQGHLDMVCEKNASTVMDFEKDPIPAYVDGDLIRARGTTLGADNGIGVAAAMAAAHDPDGRHGPLELLFTVDEETGLTGANNLEADRLKGRILLNLDSEDEGVLFVGCAGGANTELVVPVTRAAMPAGYRGVRVSVSGLKGGHSGLDIVRNRGNAARVLVRALDESAIADLLLVEIQSGNKHNAIPREAVAVVAVAANRYDELVCRIEGFDSLIKQELAGVDDGVVVAVESAEPTRLPMTRADTVRVLDLLLALPHGPIGMSQDIAGLVETSTNLAVIGTRDEGVDILCNSRSSIASCIGSVRQTIGAAGRLAGARVTFSGQYPGWRPNMSSRVLAVARKVWMDLYGKDPEVRAIHAGLECGVIGEKAPGMDMVSFGPTMRGVHSPDEQLSASSTARFYAFLKSLLAELAE